MSVVVDSLHALRQQPQRTVKARRSGRFLNAGSTLVHFEGFDFTQCWTVYGPAPNSHACVHCRPHVFVLPTGMHEMDTSTAHLLPANRIAFVSFGFDWWPGAESNHRHADFQSAALPTELPGHLFGASRGGGVSVRFIISRIWAWRSIRYWIARKRAPTAVLPDPVAAGRAAPWRGPRGRVLDPARGGQSTVWA